MAEEIAEQFNEALKTEFVRQIGEKPEQNPEYPKLITEKAFDKCERLTAEYKDRVIFGGTGDREARRFAPTVIYPVRFDEIDHKDAEIDGVMKLIAEREHPLSMYIFTSDKKWADRVMAAQQYGGGCINEVCIHMMVRGVPFNGTGHSGMGAYHGEWGFREFTHPSTVLTGRTRFNLPLREHPYSGKAGERKLKLLRMFER